MSVGEKDLDFEFRNRSLDLGYCLLRCIHFLNTLHFLSLYLGLNKKTKKDEISKKEREAGRWEDFSREGG